MSSAAGSRAGAVRDPWRLAGWEYAGIMLTYWCNARCAFCYVSSGPDRGGHLSIDGAVQIWRGLDELAARHARRMRIHLTGGEPFGDWPQLVGIVRAAREAGLTPLEKVETNGFWAASEDLTRARLELLDRLGMERLVVSADAYHQEYVPLERVQRCVRVARQVLGRRRVRVRWWDFLKQPADVRRVDRSARRASFRVALRRHRERMTGRAAQELADLLPRRPAEHLAGQSCAAEVLHSRHVHVDPYGNVFPGVCSGIILGNALREPIPRLWDRLARQWHRHPVVQAVVRGGSFELARRAQSLGFRFRSGGYVDKCHLCTDVRQFLVQRGIWPQLVGPPECYATDEQAGPPGQRGCTADDEQAATSTGPAAPAGGPQPPDGGAACAASSVPGQQPVPLTVGGLAAGKAAFCQ